jgi:hypothetical protein
MDEADADRELLYIVMPAIVSAPAATAIAEAVNARLARVSSETCPIHVCVATPERDESARRKPSWAGFQWRSRVRLCAIRRRSFRRPVSWIGLAFWVCGLFGSRSSYGGLYIFTLLGRRQHGLHPERLEP